MNRGLATILQLALFIVALAAFWRGLTQPLQEWAATVLAAAAFTAGVAVRDASRRSSR